MASNINTDYSSSDEEYQPTHQEQQEAPDEEQEDLYDYGDDRRDEWE